MVVLLQLGRRKNSYTNWLLQQQALELFICQGVLLRLTAIPKVTLNQSIFALACSCLVRSFVVCVKDYSFCLRILKSFEHPTTLALEVLRVAVNKLLYRIIMKFLIITFNKSQRLQRGGGCKCPAGTTVALVFWLCDVAFSVPAFVTRKQCTRGLTIATSLKVLRPNRGFLFQNLSPLILSGFHDFSHRNRLGCELHKLIASQI